MRLFRRNSTEDVANAESDAQDADSSATTSPTHTPGKGRPTPKRKEAEGKRRGPVTPPKTQREAIKRARGNKDERRKAAAERRERMMSGDDRYLTARDRGPVRAYVRDLVDSRRHLMGLFMPLMLVVLASVVIQNPMVQQYASLLAMAMLLTMIIEGIMIGRFVNKRVRAKFPDSKERGLSLGWYSFVRATQLRKLRVPRPRVTPKDAAKVN